MQPTPSQAADTRAPILEAQGLSKSFRGLRALDDYHVAVAPGSIHGVIGPNGAGKTTLFHLLSGFLPSTSGTIRFEGRDVTRSPAYKVSRLGVGRTFQNIRLFGDLTVLENVLIALQRRSRWSALGALFSTPGFQRAERELEAQAVELLAMFGLTDQSGRLARSLPYGDQRRLEIARAVGARPKVLLLDEPNAGMNPIETHDLLGLIRRLRDDLGITIVLVAHDIPLVMNLCDRIQVLNYGRLIAEGDPAAIRTNPDVIAAYLGQARDA
jgi:branched-chain amino acid transport system ATP-binding protein